MKRANVPIQVRSSIWMIISGILLSLIVLFVSKNDQPNEVTSDDYGIPLRIYADGLRKCRSFKEKKPVIKSSDRIRNPRFDVGFETPAVPVLISNATLIDGDGIIMYNADIVLKNGLIEMVGSYSSQRFEGQIINANGRFVTPGIIDMHSHMGLDSWPYTEGGSDTNEMTETPLHPEGKSIDGFDPWDIAIQIINSGGVTTSLVLPGSGNMMGGEAYPFKHRTVPSNRAEDMLLNAGMTSKNDGHKWRYMKMACGENPIMSYGVQKGITPESRLGEGYLFRKRIDEANQAKNDQDQWCHEAFVAEKDFKSNAHKKIKSRFPEPIQHESLIALLRGDVLLNTHCYETYDLEMLVRLSHEYNFKIRAFHHALEAWRVGDLLAKENISAAIFADHWGYKKEAYDASVNAAKILSLKGVQVAFKSDHPVLNAQNLIYEAAKGHHYGLSPELAIQAVTSIPAERLGQDWRIGYVRQGYDADVVIWDKHPLDLGAHPLKVFVDGYSTFQHIDYESTIIKDFLPYRAKQPRENYIQVKESFSSDFVTYKNIKGLVHSAEAKWEKNSKIVVENGIVTCIGSCESKGTEVDLQDGWVIPGLIASGVHLGIEVIASEKGTSAGTIDGTDDYFLKSSHSLHLGRDKSRLLDAAFKAGVTTAIVSLRNTGAVGAIGTAFRVGAKRLSDEAYIKEHVGTSLSLGNTAKNKGKDSTVSGQLMHIKETENRHVLPQVVDISSADHIHAFLKIARKNPVIIGGAEAHVIADEIAKANASVILSPARCTPAGWFDQDCLVSGKNPSAYYLLDKAGVNVGLSVKEDNFIRGLIWEAGWQVADLPDYESLSDFKIAQKSAALVTWNVAQAFGIQDKVGTIRVGRKPNFVVYNDVPGTLAARIVLVVDGELVEASTAQA